MAKYTGPKCRLSRAVGHDLLLKSGTRPHDKKCRADTLPGKAAGRRGRKSDYGDQLRMKQMIRFYYGVLEKQFRRYYQLADKRKGSTGVNLMLLLESRLDNLVYRLGFACTRAEARQLVNHGHITVNGQRVTIASYQVSLGDTIAVAERSRKHMRIDAAVEIARQRGLNEWLDVDLNKLSGVYSNYPTAEQLPPEFAVNLVVELYSK